MCISLYVVYQASYKAILQCFFFRQSIVRSVNDAALDYKEKLRERFSDIESVSVTADIWSDIKMRGFLAITCHYIHRGVLKSSNLATERFLGNIFVI